jgi:hypothetical protein
VRYLPGWLPSGQEIRSASAWAELTATETCPRPPAALVLAETDTAGGVLRSLSLHGPSPEPSRAPDGARTETVDLRGTTGTLVRYPAAAPDEEGVLRLFWTEGDGASWDLSSNHLGADALLEAAGALELSSLAQVPAALPEVPDGMRVVYQRAIFPVPALAESPWWRAYTGTGDGENDISITVRTTDAATPAVTLVGRRDARLVTVRGHDAVLLHRGDHAGTLVWDESPGVRAEVDGPFDDETLVRVAESLEHVPADDHRIQD